MSGTHRKKGCFLSVAAAFAVVALAVAIPVKANAAPTPTPTKTHTVTTVYQDGHTTVTLATAQTCPSAQLCLWTDINQSGNELAILQSTLQNGSNYNLYPGPFDNAISSFDNNTPYTISIWRDPNCPSGQQQAFPIKPQGQSGDHGNWTWLSGFNDALSCLRRTG